jgi:transposase-like protein
MKATNHPTMRRDQRAKEVLMQGMNGGGNAGDSFREYMRGAVRSALWELMQEEVSAFCGASHRPEPGAIYRRAGSDDGVMYFNGRKEAIKRPRVRRRDGAGIEREVRLKSYGAGRQKKNIEREVMAMVEEGVSARGGGRLTAQALSASEVSRSWAGYSARRIEELRGRSLAGQEYFGLMIDGVYLSRELVVVVAMGITKDGAKRILDFSAGSTESYEVARELLVRLRERGFESKGRILVVIDGAKALHKAVKEFWPDAVIQDCVIHKERNLHCYLRKGDHAECSRLVKRMRLAQGADAAREGLEALRKFLKARNAAALASLEESGERLIALQLLDVPATLNVSLQSTNLIENAIHNYRRQTRRVTRWNIRGNQVDRWSATALLWAERGFRKIKGHQDLPPLLAALGWPPPARSAAGSVPASPLRGAPATRETASTPPAAETIAPLDTNEATTYQSNTIRHF